METIDVIMNSNCDFAISGGILLGILMDAPWCNPEGCSDLDIYTNDMSQSEPFCLDLMSNRVVQDIPEVLGDTQTVVTYSHATVIHELYKNNLLEPIHNKSPDASEYGSKPYSLVRYICKVVNYTAKEAKCILQVIQIENDTTPDAFIRETFDLSCCKNYFTTTGKLVIMDPTSILKQQVSLDILSAYPQYISSANSWSLHEITKRLLKFKMRGFNIEVTCSIHDLMDAGIPAKKAYYIRETMQGIL